MNEPRSKLDEEWHQILSRSSTTGFVRKFFAICTEHGLNEVLDAADLTLLHDAAFYATLSNISFNGLGGCGGIKPERERHRVHLEQKFMAAQQRFLKSDGWRFLSQENRELIERVFLSVFVVEGNLARPR